MERFYLTYLWDLFIQQHAANLSVKYQDVRCLLVVKKLPLHYMGHC